MRVGDLVYVGQADGRRSHGDIVADDIAGQTRANRLATLLERENLLVEIEAMAVTGKD